MKINNPFSDLSTFERWLWFTSLAMIIGSFFISGARDVLNLIASLIGVTALIFISKGYIIGQFISLIFVTFYGTISFFFHYYGELIICLCLSMPLTIMVIISWFKNPYKGTKEVSISKVTKTQVLVILLLGIVVGIVFYFILEALGTANVIFSTISVATSFIASAFTYLRSPYYGICFAVNDVVLIVLWLLAVIESISYLPMLICFVMFLANDLYGFFCWRNRFSKQKTGTI